VVVHNRGALGSGVAPVDGRVRLGDGRLVDENDDCRRGPERWRADVATARPDAVVLVLGAWDAVDRQVDGEWVHPCDREFDRSYERRVRDAVSVLGSTGAPVTLALVPYLRSRVVTTDEDEGNRRIDCMNAVFRRVARSVPDLRLVDLAHWVCPSVDACRTSVGGETLRPDGIHYDGPGGTVLARWLVPQLLLPER
jgi:hypothetical protein